MVNIEKRVVGLEYGITNTDKGLADAISSQSGRDYVRALEEGGFEDIDPYLAERGEAERIFNQKLRPTINKESREINKQGFDYGLFRNEVTSDGDYQPTNILHRTRAKRSLLIRCGKKKIRSKARVYSVDDAPSIILGWSFNGLCKKYCLD